MNTATVKGIEKQLVAGIESPPKDRMAIQGRTLWYYGVEVILYETTKRGVVINVEGIEHKDVASAIEAIKEAYRSLCKEEVKGAPTKTLALPEGVGEMAARTIVGQVTEFLKQSLRTSEASMYIAAQIEHPNKGETYKVMAAMHKAGLLVRTKHPGDYCASYSLPKKPAKKPAARTIEIGMETE